MIKTIIFDFDGTIANTFQRMVEIYNEIAHKYRCKKVLSDDLDKLRSGKPQEFMRAFGISPMKLLFLVAAIRGKLKRDIGDITIQPGIPEMLGELKKSGIILGILTSNSRENVERFLTQNNLKDSFSFIHSSRHLFGKDRILRSIINKQSLKSQDIAYVGDEIRDIEAAKKAGVVSVGVTWGFQTEAALQNVRPNFLFSNPKQLYNLLAGNTEEVL